MGSKRRRRRSRRRQPRRPLPYRPFRPESAHRRRTPVGPRRRAFERWVNSPRVAGWILVIVALGCGVFALAYYDDAVRLRDKGERAVGEVVEVHDGRDAYVVMRFRTRDGREVVTEVSSYRWSPRPRVGDRQELVYDPDYPADNVSDARIGPDFVAPLLLAGGGVVAAVVARLTFTGRIDWREWDR